MGFDATAAAIAVAVAIVVGVIGAIEQAAVLAEDDRRLVAVGPAAQPVGVAVGRLGLAIGFAVGGGGGGHALGIGRPAAPAIPRRHVAMLGAKKALAKCTL